ncbi:SMI1/KNR4 family protein [Actinoplanes flavus]|uniref:SMI1/KNR4 family protein n=1 Tax=Actinoplanes flavus TaxID=2820290 RepID=A0ABS3USW4_9ACTN|nr:SMI1/KNR4 family protein [Actinoplanes flavus]MBO3741673.1 SMI1/KNR4 family protein [Actinoplanes flavus]
MTSFEDVAATFWDSGDTDLTQPPLTDEMITAAEAELGVRLPAALIRLLRQRNGGSVADGWDACPAAPNSWAADHVPFDHLHGIAPPGRELSMALQDTGYLVREWGLPSPVVLLSGDGHTWVALDYRDCGPDGDPPVVFLDADRGRQLPVAPDFRTFVERLTPAAGFPDESTTRP